MIVAEDFLEHWKVAKFTHLLGVDEAPLFVLRLWIHCYRRKAWRFEDMDYETLAAICRYKDSPNKLAHAFYACRFLDSDDPGVIRVHQWEEYNLGIVTSWENGRKGGRPKGSPVTPQTTRGKPADNPRVSDGIPTGNLLETDREEEIDKKEKKEKKGVEGDKPLRSAAPPLEAVEFPAELDTDEFRTAWNEWNQYRREAKLRPWKPLTIRKQLVALADMGAGAAIDAINHSIANAFQGIHPPAGPVRGGMKKNVTEEAPPIVLHELPVVEKFRNPNVPRD